eukprot:6200289-Pleurochrysis_carterae.AAC.1
MGHNVEISQKNAISANQPEASACQAASRASIYKVLQLLLLPLYNGSPKVENRLLEVWLWGLQGCYSIALFEIASIKQRMVVTRSETSFGHR